MAFTLEERQRLGIHGLLPPRFKTQEQQVALCMRNVARYDENLNKYIYLMGLQVSMVPVLLLEMVGLGVLGNVCKVGGSKMMLS